MQKYIKSQILSQSGYVLALILILQLSLPGFALSLGSDDHRALQSYNDDSSPSSVLCIEDVEDKGIDLSSKSLNLFGLGDSKLFLINTNSPNNYIHCQLHSRSPPNT